MTLALVAILPFVTSEHHTNLPSGVRIIRNIQYVPDSVDPLQQLDLFLPRLNYNKRMPLIIWIHGGGWIEGGKSDSPAIDLARLGFASAAINYRLAPKSIFPAQIHDCKAAVRWLRAHAQEYKIDPNRIGVWGLSSGGHLAALLATTSYTNELSGSLGNNEISASISACCDWCGPTDLIKFRSQCAPDATYSTISPPDLIDLLLGGPADENEELARKASPVNYVREKCPPILIMHAKEDPIVPFIQSQIFANKLEEAGAPVELIKVKSDEHVFLTEGTFKTVTEFFRQKLKDAKNTQPSSSNSAKQEAALDTPLASASSYQRFASTRFNATPLP